MEYYLTCREDTLQHFGTRGMKWGRRQYQYQDGTYTPAGKVRYGIGDGHSYNGTHNSRSMQNSKQKSQSNNSSKKKSLSKKQKIAIGLGTTAAVGTVLAAYGLHKYSETRKANIAKHKRDVDEILKDLEIVKVDTIKVDTIKFDTVKVDTVDYNAHLQSNLNEIRKYAAGMK